MQTLDSKERRKSSPFWKKSSYQGKPRSLQKDNGPEKSDEDTEEEAQAAREKS